MEDVASFRQRARSWIRDNLRAGEAFVLTLRDRSDEDELAGVARDREV